MEMQIIRGSNLQKIAHAVGSSRRKVNVRICKEGEKSTNIGGWDGGSRIEDYYFTGLDCVRAQQNEPFGMNNAPKVVLDAEHALVSGGTFCGKPAMPYIYCTQEYFEKYLKE